MAHHLASQHTAIKAIEKSGKKNSHKKMTYPAKKSKSASYPKKKMGY